MRSDSAEVGVLAAHILAQLGFAIHNYGIHRQIDKQIGLQGGCSNAQAHIVPYLCLRAGSLPDTYLVQATYPPLVGV